MRDSVRLNSFKSFLVTLSSTSSETWEMYSWAISGSSVFCYWLFLVLSGVCLETAADFLLFLKVAMILREISVSCEDWIIFQFVTKVSISSIMRGKGFNKDKQLMISQNDYNTKKLKLYIIKIVLSFLLFIHFPWRETKLFTSQFKLKIGKSTFIILSIKEKCRHWREKTPLRPFLPSSTASLSSFDGKSTGPIR